jgi:hypothetical protein
MARNQAELNERKRNLEYFSLTVLEPLRVAHARWKIANAAEQAASPSPVNGELMHEAPDDEFYNAIDIDFAEEEREIIACINRAIETATNPRNKSYAPAIYHELVHIVGDAELEGRVGESQLTELKTIVKEQEALSNPDINLTIPRTPIQYFIAKQDEFIQEMHDVDESLSTATTETEAQRVVLWKYQAALQDLFSHYEAFKANADASSQRSIASFYETKEPASVSTASMAPAPLPEPSFMPYIQAQRALSTLEPRMKQIKLSEKTLQGLEAPQKNIRHTPDLLSSIQKAEPASNPTGKDQFKAIEVETHTEAKSVYLQVRTLRHFKQWDGKTSNAKQVDKQQAILRSLLQLNMRSVAELQKSNGRGPRDEVADFDTYLKTVLVDGYPEIFTLNAEGELTVKLDEGQYWNTPLGGEFEDKNIRAKDIEFALGLHEDEDGPDHKHDTPPLTQKMAQNKLIGSDPKNPLWAILKSMTPVNQSPMVDSKQLPLAEKVESYRDMIKRIENGQLGEFDKENRGLKAAKAIIAEIQYQHTQSTVLTPDIKEALEEMRPIIAGWENKDTDYLKFREDEEYLDADSFTNILTNFFVISFRRLFSIQRNFGTRGFLWNAERKYIQASTDCDQLIKTISTGNDAETASEVSSDDGLDHGPGSDDDGHDHPPADSRNIFRRAWDSLVGNQPDRESHDIERGSLGSVGTGNNDDNVSAAGSEEEDLVAGGRAPGDGARSESGEDEEENSSDERSLSRGGGGSGGGTGGAPGGGGRRHAHPPLSLRPRRDPHSFSHGGTGGGGGGSRNLNDEKSAYRARNVAVAEPVHTSSVAQGASTSAKKKSGGSLFNSLRSSFSRGRQNTEEWAQVTRDHHYSIYDQKMSAVFTNIKQMLDGNPDAQDRHLLEQIRGVVMDKSQAHTDKLRRACEWLSENVLETQRADSEWGIQLLNALYEAHKESISIDLTQGEVHHVDAHDVQRPRPRGELPSYGDTAIPVPKSAEQPQSGAHAIPTAQAVDRSNPRGSAASGDEQPSGKETETGKFKAQASTIKTAAEAGATRGGPTTLGF